MFKTVLYIEDNLYSRLLVKRILEAKNITVFEAEDGLSGVSQAENLLPDLIIIDLNLPDIDGYEVAKRLRTKPQLIKTPIIALTANATKELDQKKTLAAGYDSYLQKPIDTESLQREIAAFL